MALSRFNPTTSRTTAGTARSILYVEDEDTNWEVTEFALRDRYKLTRAQNSRDAFKLLSSNRYDLILMDIQLSGSELNGIEITRISMPDGPIVHATPAAETISGPAEQAYVPWADGPDALVPGENVIAVEVHQVGPGSSDLGFDLELALLVRP